LHDALYEHQAALSPKFIATMARRLGVDLARFDEDMQSHRFEDRVQRDLAGAVRSGVTSTPAFFINGMRYRGALDERALTQAMDAAAASTRKT
jgi:protein-disulfide isomerase